MLELALAVLTLSSHGLIMDKQVEELVKHDLEICQPQHPDCALSLQLPHENLNLCLYSEGKKRQLSFILDLAILNLTSRACKEATQ